MIPESEWTDRDRADLEKAAQAIALLIELFGGGVLRRALRIVLDRRKADERRAELQRRGAS